MRLSKLIITGSSSGGHIFPGIAIADQLSKINPTIEIIFLMNWSSLEQRIFKNSKYNSNSIPTRKFKRKHRVLKLAYEVPRLTLKVKKILNEFKPQLVISVGGYFAGPVGIVAKVKQIPLVICEQNSSIGVTNKLLSTFASRIYTSFEKTKGLKNNKKVFFYGNPIRSQILSKNKKNINNSTCTKNKFNILILGGSQGAHAINIAILEALKHIKNTDKIKFIHQTGIMDEQLVKNRYLSQNIDSKVAAFFSEIGPYYREANIVICRAGGTTIAELTAIGKCSILIPYPFAAENHQVLNAQAIANANAATIILQKDLNGVILAKHIEFFINNPKIVNSIQLKSKKIGSIKAAKLIVDNINKILK